MSVATNKAISHTFGVSDCEIIIETQKIVIEDLKAEIKELQVDRKRLEHCIDTQGYFHKANSGKWCFRIPGINGVGWFHTPRMAIDKVRNK
jgi:hypothetical protein